MSESEPEPVNGETPVGLYYHAEGQLWMAHLGGAVYLSCGFDWPLKVIELTSFEQAGLRPAAKLMPCDIFGDLPMNWADYTQRWCQWT